MLPHPDHNSWVVFGPLHRIRFPRPGDKPKSDVSPLFRIPHCCLDEEFGPCFSPDVVDYLPNQLWIESLLSRYHQQHLGSSPNYSPSGVVLQRFDLLYYFLPGNWKVDTTFLTRSPDPKPGVAARHHTA